MMNKIVGALPWLLATLLVAGLTHFVAILILPKVATRDAYERLAAGGMVERMTLLPSSGTDGTMIPFLDPATVQGLCFFNVDKGPVRLKARVEEGRLLTLSFRTREGRIFYAMTDRAALHGMIDIRLVSESQLQQVEAGDDEEQGLPSELRLKTPSAKGLIVATALVARPGDRQDAEARIRAIDCRTEPLAAP